MLEYKENVNHEFKTTQLRISSAKLNLKINKQKPVTSLLTKYFTHRNNSKPAPPMLYFGDNRNNQPPYPDNNHLNNYIDNNSFFLNLSQASFSFYCDNYYKGFKGDERAYIPHGAKLYREYPSVHLAFHPASDV